MMNFAPELRRRARELNHAAQKLLEAADTLDGKLVNRNGGPLPKPTRLEQLRLFLMSRGPMWRPDIIVESGLPAGTVAGYLTTKNFGKDEDGRWYVPEKDLQLVK